MGEAKQRQRSVYGQQNGRLAFQRREKRALVVCIRLQFHNPGQTCVESLARITRSFTWNDIFFRVFIKSKPGKQVNTWPTVHARNPLYIPPQNFSWSFSQFPQNLKRHFSQNPQNVDLWRAPCTVEPSWADESMTLNINTLNNCLPRDGCTIA